MTYGKMRRAFPYRVLLSALMGAVILYLVINLVAQAGVRLELRERLGQVEQQIVVAEQENSVLADRLEYLASNDAAEEWARDNGWAREDEVLVVVLAPDAANIPGDQAQPAGQVTPVSTRASWWNLFFGER